MLGSLRGLLVGISCFYITLRPPNFWMLDVVDTHCSGKREREREIEKTLPGLQLFAGIYLYRLVHFMSFDVPST